MRLGTNNGNRARHLGNGPPAGRWPGSEALTFYQELSRDSDEIFALAPGEMDFLKRRLNGCARILDVGCGTGNKTELLSEPNREIVGLDLDPDMIALARLKHQAPGLTYQVGDMAAIGLKYPAGQFDGLVCLGNTLVHLTGSYELETFMAGAGRILRPGGWWALQILNYDFIIKSRLSELPLIETPKTVFRRFYDWRADGLRFRTVLEIKNGPVYENEIFLRPIVKNELLAILAGNFSEVELFGGYDGSPHRPDSLVTLALARRNGY